MVYPVILAGGSGSRLWPISQPHIPKQFLKLFNDKSLYQNTIERLNGYCEPEQIRTACHRDHVGRISKELSAMGLPIDNQIIAEPESRNTAPAIYLAAAKLKEQDEDAILVVLPADHYVDDEEQFREALRQAEASASQGKIVTLGIQPTAPETGYGYIEATPLRGAGIRAVKRFVEKPDPASAARYLASGRFLWNSGIFVFKAQVMLAEFVRYQPEVVTAVDQFIAGDESAYTRSPKISIDYAVMEQTEKAMVLPTTFGWSDVGTWSAVHQQGKPDAAGNTLRGDVIVEHCSNSLVHTSHQRVAALGIKDTIVVASQTGVLVCHRDHVQAVSGIAALPPDQEAWGYQEHRPWGSYTILGSSNSFKTKRLDLLPGKRLSLQSHKHRTEYWIVVTGQARVTLDEQTLEMGPNETVRIPVSSKHRVENMGTELLTIVEVQLGSYFGEDDIERYHDDFGRK